MSECVGLDLNDVDFSVNGFLITRKGGQRVVLYFPEEVADVLREYIDERKTIQAQPGTRTRSSSPRRSGGWTCAPCRT